MMMFMNIIVGNMVVLMCVMVCECEIPLWILLLYFNLLPSENALPTFLPNWMYV